MSYGAGYDDLVVEAIAGRRPSATTGTIRAHCPLCELAAGKDVDRRFSLRFNVVSSRYSCYRCGSYGRIQRPFEEYASFAVDAAPDEIPEFVEPPDGFYALSEEAGRTAEVFAVARNYLFGDRGVSEEACAFFKIGACARGRFAGRIIIPVLSLAGSWRWYVGRVWVKQHDRAYLYPFGAKRSVMFNEQALELETDEPLLVVEGCFDAIAHFPNAVAVLGKTTDDHLDMLRQAKRPVVFVPDGDEWQSGYALSMRLRLDGIRTGALRLPPRVDPDEVSREEMRAAALESLE